MHLSSERVENIGRCGTVDNTHICGPEGPAEVHVLVIFLAPLIGVIIHQLQESFKPGAGVFWTVTIIPMG